jgi:predicted ester cyclase
MAKKRNGLFMSRFLEFINTASEKLASELIFPEAVFHVPGRPEPMRGPGGYLEIIGMMRGGFPDIQWTLEETITEGDMLAARFTMRGTHNGTFFWRSAYRQQNRGPGNEFLSLVWRTNR